jgi:L-alanine-DL-glutamate epimerase-like enolase superfamily enzyme
MEEPLQDYDLLGLKRLSDRLDLPILALEWIGYLGGQPFNASAFLAQQACDIVRQRGVGITGQMKLAHLAESFGALVHGGNHHVILAIRNDPIFEAYMGIKPRPPEVELDCRGTLVVENGAMSIAYNDRRPPEPDWDAYGRQAVELVS